MTERQVLFDAILVRGMNGRAAAQPAPALRVLGLHQVAPACALAQYLAAGRDLESFRGGFLCFNAFWTSHKVIRILPKKSAQYK